MYGVRDPVSRKIFVSLKDYQKIEKIIDKDTKRSSKKAENSAPI